MPTHGGHNQFPRTQLEELLAGIGAAIDAVGGSFTMRYSAVVVTAARPTPPDPPLYGRSGLMGMPTPDAPPSDRVGRGEVTTGGSLSGQDEGSW